MAVREIVTHLAGCQALDMAAMREALAAASIGPGWVARHQPDPIPVEGYGREVLHSDPQYELVLATWPVKGGTLPHDHGQAESEGMVLIVSGEIFNDVFEKDGEGRLRHIERQYFKAGEFLPVPKGLIHSMGNNLKDTFSMSLHIYAPSIADVTYWDPESLEELDLVGATGVGSVAVGGREV